MKRKPTKKKTAPRPTAASLRMVELRAQRRIDALAVRVAKVEQNITTLFAWHRTIRDDQIDVNSYLRNAQDMKEAITDLGRALAEALHEFTPVQLFPLEPKA